MFFILCDAFISKVKYKNKVQKTHIIKLNKKINDKHLSVGFIGSGYIGLPVIKKIIKSGFIMKVQYVNTKITKNLNKYKIIAMNKLRAITNNNFNTS